MSAEAARPRIQTRALFTPQLRTLTLGLLLGVLLIAFESLAVATVLPLVGRELNGLALYGWAFSAFFVGYLLSTVALGQLADRLGPRVPYLLALGLFAAGLLVAGTAQHMGVFIGGRALQGLGGGGAVAVMYQAINRAYPDAVRARMLALLSAAWVLPALVGPWLAGRLAETFSWHVVFLGLLPLAGLVVLLSTPALGRLGAAGTRVDLRRLRFAALAAVGVTLALVALQQQNLWLGLGLGAAGLLCAVPALRGLFSGSRGPLGAGYATRFALTSSFFGFEAFVPLGLNELRGLSAGQAGLALTASALTWSATSALHSRFDERTGGKNRHRVSKLGTGLVALSLGLTGAVLLTQVPVWWVGFTWALGGLGMGLGFQSHTLVVFQHAPDGQEGQVSGTLQVADVLGSALGAGLGGAFIAWLGLRTGLTGMVGLAVTLAALGVLAAGRLRGRGKAYTGT